jgi:hypothetical protein
MAFTAQQLADWKKYERVRKGGRFNMFDPRARQATGLGPERYSFALKNYSELKEAVEGHKTTASD